MFSRHWHTAIAGIATLLFLLDRLIAGYLVANPHYRWGFIFGLFDIQLARNTGVAFSIPLPHWLLFILLPTLLFLVVAWWLDSYHHHDFATASGLILIIVGAVANGLDRLRYGFIVDYINVPWFTVFNLADVMITLGALIVILMAIQSRRLYKPATKA